MKGVAVLGYKKKKEQGFSEPANLARRLKGSKLSEVMAREPESKSFLDQAGFEKRGPAGSLGFFVLHSLRSVPVRISDLATLFSQEEQGIKEKGPFCDEARKCPELNC